MANIDQNSARQRIVRLNIGEAAEFDIGKHESIRSQCSRLSLTLDREYTVTVERELKQVIVYRKK